MRYTPVRLYVFLDLVVDGKLVITRNGAQEPGIGAYDRLGSPFSQRRLLTAVEDLHRAGMISFAEKTTFGLYVGKAEVAPIGRNRLHIAYRTQQELAELAERHAAERVAFEEKRAEELAAFKDANQVLKEDEQEYDPFEVQRVAAAERVRASLDIYRRELGADLDVAAIMVRVSGDTIVNFDVADLLLLCDAVAGQR